MEDNNHFIDMLEDCHYDLSAYADELLCETILLSPSELEDTLTELIEDQQLDEEDEEEREREMRFQFLGEFREYIKAYPEPREDENIFEYFHSLLENYGRREFCPPKPYSTTYITKLRNLGFQMHNRGGIFFL